MQLGRRILNAVMASLILAGSGAAWAIADECGDPFNNPTGPFDYRRPEAKMLGMVEGRHYTESVRALRRGNTGSLAGDLAYTLRVYPNHYRALMTMSEWSFKTRSNRPEGQPYTVECWFERGLRFAPDDPMVKVAYGIHLIKAGRSKDAVRHLEAAIAEDGGNGSAHYNLGLAYAALNQYDKALASAHRAYGLGFPLPGLRDRLKRAGAWREAEPAAQVPAAPAVEAPAEAADAPPAAAD